jgi:integrase
MSLYRRNTVWWVRFTTPSGERVRRSTGTTKKEEAQEYHDRLKAEIWKTLKLGRKPRRTWEQAAVRWLKEKSHKASLDADRMHLRWLDRHLRGMELSAINRAVLDRLIEVRRAEGVSNATVNRTMEVVRAILRKAANEWEWIDRAPAVRMLPEPKRRIRWLTQEEAERLIEELPEHLAEMARFSLATGLRKANVTGLEWSQVNLERRIAWIHPDQAKARKAIGVPLNAEAILVLRRQMGKHPRFVCTHRGKPVRSVNTKAWKAALRRASVADFRDGTTCAIPGRHGTHRRAHRQMSCRSSVVGSRRIWCDAMRISLRSISRNLQSVCRGPARSVAQIWHTGKVVRER